MKQKGKKRPLGATEKHSTTLDQEMNEDFMNERSIKQKAPKARNRQEPEDVTEEDERILAAFLSRDAAPQRTLADIIMAKIREKEEAAGISTAAGGEPPARVWGSPREPEEELAVAERAGLDLELPLQPQLFARADFDYGESVVLHPVRPEALPAVGKLLRRYKAGKVPKAFKVIPSLAQWEESGTCTLREAFIIGSVLQKVSIPVLHSRLPTWTTPYALPYRVVDALTAHFLRFEDEERELPVIWHQALLTFVQRYKNELSEGDKEDLKRLMRRQRHYLMTPEIQRELQHSRHRGEKEDPGILFDILFFCTLTSISQASTLVVRLSL
eukprot:jgi/Mesen1/10692/ME000009S10483